MRWEHGVQFCLILCKMSAWPPPPPPPPPPRAVQSGVSRHALATGTALQNHKAVSAHFTSKQIQPSGFARRPCSAQGFSQSLSRALGMWRLHPRVWQCVCDQLTGCKLCPKWDDSLAGDTHRRHTGIAWRPSLQRLSCSQKTFSRISSQSLSTRWHTTYIYNV